MPKGFYFLFVSFFILGQSLAEQPKRSETPSARLSRYSQVSGFKEATSTALKINEAMRTAAENPMDEWRREKLQEAVKQWPKAIQALAQDFFKGNLKDADLPHVQKFLGSFVDVDAADVYKKFLKNPSSESIPTVSPELKEHFEATSSKNSKSIVSARTPASVDNEEIASLGEPEESQEKIETAKVVTLSSSPSKESSAMQTQSVVMDENIEKEIDLKTDREINQEVVNTSSDIKLPESEALKFSLKAPASNPTVADFFGLSEKKQENNDDKIFELEIDKYKEEQKKKAAKEIANETLEGETIAPQFWAPIPWNLTKSILLPKPAHAEGGQVIGQALMGAAQAAGAVAQAKAQVAVAKEEGKTSRYNTDVTIGGMLKLKEMEIQGKDRDAEMKVLMNKTQIDNTLHMDAIQKQGDWVRETMRIESDRRTEELERQDRHEERMQDFWQEITAIQQQRVNNQLQYILGQIQMQVATLPAVSALPQREMAGRNFISVQNRLLTRATARAPENQRGLQGSQERAQQRAQERVGEVSGNLARGSTSILRVKTASLAPVSLPTIRAFMDRAPSRQRLPSSVPGRSLSSHRRR